MRAIKGGGKMELLYIWIGKYKNIRNKEFTISQNYNIHYDVKTKQLKIEKEQTIPNIFGENISNITLLVGKNGSGKTTLLETLTQFKIDSHQDTIFLVLYRTMINEGEHFIAETYHSKHDSLLCDISNPTSRARNIFIKRSNNNDTWENLNKDALEKLNFCLLHNIVGVEEKSTLSPRLKKVKLNEETSNALDIILNENIKKTLDRIKWDANPILKININVCNNEFDEIIPNLIPPERTNSKVESRSLKLKKLLQTQVILLNNLLHYLGNNSKFDRSSIDNIMQYKYSQLSVTQDWYNNCITSLKFILDNLNEHEFVDVFKKYVNVLDEFDENHFGENYIYLPLYKLNQAEIKALQTLRELTSHYPYIKSVCSFESISLSSGELSLLRQLYNINNIIDRPLTSSKSISYLIALDEPESHLHPEWARRYLHLIIMYLNVMDNVNFQLILTTHSPFLLSDMPKENIRYLDNLDIIGNTLPSTFAANIHTLLADNMFMDSTIGEFAKQKINDLIFFLQGRDSKFNYTKEEVKYLINSVGENMLKNSLYNLYNEKYKTDVQQQIEFYKKEIQKLENLKN